MLRYAAVRLDGSIARIVTAPGEEAIELNMPPGVTKIAAPVDVMSWSHTYDLDAEEFRQINGETQPHTT